MKTSELTGSALDWAVAKCSDFFIEAGSPHNEPLFLETAKYSPSTNWAQGGPIIERIKGFELKQWLECRPESCCEAHIHNYDGNWIEFGPTPLIAAMRCYVASRLGDEVEIPEELT